jgi:hypothetical protein
MLRNGIRSRRSERRSHLRNTKVPQTALEDRAIAAIAIVNQKSWRPSIPKHSIRPTAGPSTLQSDMPSPQRARISLLTCRTTKKDVQGLEQDCPIAKEVPSPYIRFMPFQELAPSWGWFSAGTHVLGDPGRNPKSQSCEFGLDSLLTPEPVLSSHLSDEGPKVSGNRPSTNRPVLPI